MAVAIRKTPNVFYDRYVNTAPRSHMAYAMDVWKPSGEMSKHFGGFNTVDDFLRHYASCAPMMCHYEILRDTTPMAVAFDLDVKYTKNSHTETIEAMGFTPSNPDGVLRIATEHIVEGCERLQRHGTVLCAEAAKRGGEVGTCDSVAGGVPVRRCASRRARRGFRFAELEATGRCFWTRW